MTKRKKKTYKLDDGNISNFVLEFIFILMLYFKVKLKEQEQYPEFIWYFVIYQMFYFNIYFSKKEKIKMGWAKIIDPIFMNENNEVLRNGDKRR